MRVLQPSDRMTRLLLVILVCLLVLWAFPAHSQGGPGLGDCGPRDSVVGFFSQRFAAQRDTPTIEISHEGAVLLEHVTTRTAWYRLATRPPGITCIVGMGLRT